MGAAGSYSALNVTATHTGKLLAPLLLSNTIEGNPFGISFINTFVSLLFWTILKYGQIQQT